MDKFLNFLKDPATHIVIVLILFVIAAIMSERYNQQSIAEQLCDANGGKVIYANNNETFCIKKSAFVGVKGIRI